MKPRPVLIADIPRSIYVINNILTLPFLIGCALFFNTYYPDTPTLILPVLVGAAGYFVFLSRNYIHARTKVDAIEELLRTLDNDQKTEVAMYALEKVIKSRRTQGMKLQFENNKTGASYDMIFGESANFDKIIKVAAGLEVEGVTQVDSGNDLSNLNKGRLQ